MIRRSVTITVLPRAAGTDENGDPVAPDEEDEGHTIRRCAVAPRASSDNATRGRDGILVGASLYAPADADLLRTDRLTIGHPGFPGVWEIEGEIGVWGSPFTSRRSGIEVALRRAEG